MKPKVEPRGKRDTRPYPFPGNKNIRKLRHLFHATWFIKILESLAKKNKHGRPNTVFLFGVTLKETVAALHRLYLDPDGSIYPILRNLMSREAEDLSQLIEPKPGGSPGKAVLEELQYAIENITYHITEIMPKTGVLGTHKKAGVFEMIVSGKRYPDGYFWNVEMDKLQFNESGRTVNIGELEAALLLTGIFVSRGLVSTLLLNPSDYGLEEKDMKAQRNLQVLASVLMYLVRKVAVPNGESPMDIPQKLSQYLLTDKEMKNVLVKMKRSIDYAENLLREWGKEYVKRLKLAAVSTHKA